MVHSLLSILKNGIQEIRFHARAFWLSALLTCGLILIQPIAIYLLSSFSKGGGVLSGNIIPLAITIITSVFIIGIVVFAIIQWYETNVDLACRSYDKRDLGRISWKTGFFRDLSIGIELFILLTWSIGKLSVFMSDFFPPFAHSPDTSFYFEHLLTISPLFILTQLVCFGFIVWWTSRLLLSIWFAVDRCQNTRDALRSSWQVTKPYGLRMYGVVGVIKIVESILMAIPIVNLAAPFWTILMMTYLYRAIAPLTSHSSDERAVEQN